MSKQRPITGTREWSTDSANVATGCEHNCRYCFARYDAVERFKRVRAHDWAQPELRPSALHKKWKKCAGRVMFPTQHDIVPGPVLIASVGLIANVLSAGNEMLLVTKPHLECVKMICDTFPEFKDKILWRFTIGSSLDGVLRYWEPGAPSFAERFASLQHAYREGFGTSVSCEPLLHRPEAVDLFYKLAPFVTDTIWFGDLNRAQQRVQVENETDRNWLESVLAGQTTEKKRDLYEILQGEPKVRWKESYKLALGLPLATEPGQDV